MASYVYDPIVSEPEAVDFSTGNVLEIINDFSRVVNVDVYIDDKQVTPEIVQTLTQVSITFYENGEPVIPTGDIKVIIS